MNTYRLKKRYSSLVFRNVCQKSGTPEYGPLSGQIEFQEVGMKARIFIPAALMTLTALAPWAAQGQFTVVAGGLNSPRGLTFGPGGELYVAQAGSGGTTGKISKISNPGAPTPVFRDVVTGLISVVHTE